MTFRILAIATALAPLASLAAGGATPERHRHVAARPAVATVPRPAAAARSYSFYPEEIEGGVSGNLPFNNQIRKHTDPLNANGGR